LQYDRAKVSHHSEESDCGNILGKLTRSELLPIVVHLGKDLGAKFLWGAKDLPLEVVGASFLLEPGQQTNRFQ
jgi:hypothetical protein